jgi:hypothetical protein
MSTCSSRWSATPSHACLGPEARPSAALASGVIRALREVRRHDLVHVHGEAAAGLCLTALASHASVVTLHGLHLVRRLHGAARRLAVAQLAPVVRAASRTASPRQSADLFARTSDRFSSQQISSSAHLVARAFPTPCWKRCRSDFAGSLGRSQDPRGSRGLRHCRPARRRFRLCSAYRRLLRDANERRILGQRASQMIRRTQEVYELVGRGDTG